MQTLAAVDGFRRKGTNDLPKRMEHMVAARSIKGGLTLRNHYLPFAMKNAFVTSRY